MKTISIVILIITAFSISSCSTILYGKREEVSFNSFPEGAEIFINNKSTGKYTPAIINVDKKNLIREPGFKGYKFELRKEGYLPYVEKSKRKYHLTAATIGNVGFAASSGAAAIAILPFIAASKLDKSIDDKDVAFYTVVGTVFTVPIALIVGPIIDIKTGSVKMITRNVQVDLIPLK